MSPFYLPNYIGFLGVDPLPHAVAAVESELNEEEGRTWINPCLNTENKLLYPPTVVFKWNIGGKPPPENLGYH